jgi:hypothetical protein
MAKKFLRLKSAVLRIKFPKKPSDETISKPTLPQSEATIATHLSSLSGYCVQGLHVVNALLFLLGFFIL